MSTLVEQMEALQEKWRQQSGRERLVPNMPYDLTWGVAKQGDADELAPLIVRAKEQERELAALKEPMECGHPKAFLDGINQDRAYAAQYWCSLCKQHSADLLAIAEMALRIDLMDYPFEASLADIAKEVVAEFERSAHEGE